MIITTSHAIDGKVIAQYVGPIGAAVVSANMGGGKMLDTMFSNGISSVNQLLQKRAGDLRADAVIAVAYDIQGGNIYATGTAVRLA